MKPENASRSLLSVTRAKAKMYEFRVPEHEHIALTRHPARLISLAVGLLGDAAAWLADDAAESAPDIEDLLGAALGEAGRRESYDALGFAATFFDAFIDTRLDREITAAYSNETGQEFRSLTGRLFQRYTGRGSEAKPDGRNVSGSWFINVGVYRLGQA